MADEEVLPDCPRCDALKEQLAEMRAEFLQQARQSQDATTQIMMRFSEAQNKLQSELLDIIKGDRVLLKEIITMRKT